MTTDVIDFGQYEVYPGDNAAHEFAGWPKDEEVSSVNNEEEE